jgi:3-dehydroquinate dehydratase II
MTDGRKRIAVMHGVNLDQLGRRDPAIYGPLTLAELEQRIEQNEGAFVEHLHGLREQADAVLLNPGAWTHYSWAIRDALEIAGLPAVEIHLSDVQAREEWRRTSVIGELCFATVSGRGAEGYDEALVLLREELERSER